MVVYYLLVGCLHKTVKCLRCEPLEPCVGLALLAHTIDNVLALGKLACHINDSHLVVLKVGVDGDNGVAHAETFLHACPESVLMALIVRQLYACHIAVLRSEAFYKLPSAVAATVVHKQQTSLDAGLSLHLAYHGLQFPHCPRQDFLLVVAGNDNADGLFVVRLLVHISLINVSYGHSAKVK